MAFNPWEQYNASLSNLGQTVNQLGQQDIARQNMERQNSLADLQIQKAALDAPVEAKQRQLTTVNLDDKLAEYGAKVSAGQGDINEYHKGKQTLDRMKQLGEAVKPYVTKPQALQEMWPQIVQAFPEFKNVDPKVFRATPDGIMTPFKTPDGQEVPNMFYLYDNEGKMQIKEVKPEKSVPITTRDMPVAGGMIQRMQFNTVTGKDEPYGVPFKPVAQQRIEIGEKPKPGKPLPASQLESLSDSAQLIKTLKEAKEISPKVNTGMVSGRLQSLGQTVGMANEDFNQLKQKLSTVENIMLKLRSGAAVTESEYKRFMNEMPTVNDDEKVRDTKMNNAVQYAEELLAGKTATYEEGGYKIPTGLTTRSQPGKRTVQPPQGKGIKSSKDPLGIL